MFFFLVLHIAALLFWTASLLYLPAMIAGGASQFTFIEGGKSRSISVPSFLFSRIATPAALAAIVAGTGVFILDRTVNPWLIVKLTLVTGLVLIHSAIGLLIIRSEHAESKPVGVWCLATGSIAALLTCAIVWLVLAKPEVEALT